MQQNAWKMKNWKEKARWQQKEGYDGAVRRVKTPAPKITPYAKLVVNEKEKLQEIKAGRKPLTLERPGLMPATAKIIVAIKPKGEGEAVFLSQKHFFVDDK